MYSTVLVKDAGAGRRYRYRKTIKEHRYIRLDRGQSNEGLKLARSPSIPNLRSYLRYIEGDALQKHTYEWKESMEDPGLRIFGRKTGRPRLGYEEERSHSSRNKSLIVLRIAITHVAMVVLHHCQHAATAILKFFPTLPSLGAVLPYPNSTIFSK